MRDRARAVVIGGGVGGCSILYWLARLGWQDVVLVERADLTSGSTFHSAGLVGQLRGSLSLTKMMMSSVELYRALGDEVGLETGWHEVGSLRLGSSEERMEELRRQAGWAKTFGLPLELISAEEAQRLFPPMSTEGVLGAAYLPTDGYIDPSQLTFALAAGARRRGAEIATNTRVTDIRVEGGRVAGVETDRGSIGTEVVVNAGGMFAAEIGRLAGVTVPVSSSAVRSRAPPWGTRSSTITSTTRGPNSGSSTTWSPATSASGCSSADDAPGGTPGVRHQPAEQRLFDHVVTCYERERLFERG